MTEQELRALVRDAIARQAGNARVSSSLAVAPSIVRQHPSHGMFLLPTGSDADGPCVIEPAVPCNHCGYCKSMGH
ncbi:MAG: hypothetical protein ABL993_10315 [Vicinamibacterales bacterium]